MAVVASVAKAAVVSLEGGSELFSYFCSSKSGAFAAETLLILNKLLRLIMLTKMSQNLLRLNSFSLLVPRSINVRCETFLTTAC